MPTSPRRTHTPVHSGLPTPHCWSRHKKKEITVSEEFTPGERIRVVRCTDEHDPLPAGATGTVRAWNPTPWLRQLALDYDPPHDHRRLMLTLTDGADIVEKL
ncbi:hypothetical protein ACF09H_22205 [Streptomyces sp. NPDC014983]|uniref:hypothetical protein n=1 Tax=Streptomyces sp. NPDC014983 TaxID=3364933 RepID=UPI003702AEDB